MRENDPTQSEELALLIESFHDGLRQCPQLTSKTGVDATQPSWLQSQKELLMSTPRGVGLQDFDTWSDWMLNGFVVLVRETEPMQIDRLFS